jgi:PQQ-dependent catabolism-associated CXXCW motif protein
MSLASKILAALLGVLFAVPCFAQSTATPQAATTTFADEDRDWGIPATSKPRRKPYHAPIPRTIPGAKVIHTFELQALLEKTKDAIVIDVLDSRDTETIPGAYLMAGGGDGNFYGAEKARFASAVDGITKSDKNRPLIFLCRSSECWLSYNASLHALDIGYKDVYWYRGGRDAWKGANLERKPGQRLSW